MKILIVGGGGREHALAWKIANDSTSPDVFCAPGNAGTTDVATNVPIGAEDIDAIVEWASENRPDLTVVGPEAPLCAGITDRLNAIGLRVFGPTEDAAQLEGSKIFAKELMQAAGVPTAAAETFTDADAARAYLEQVGAPVVVKAEGLAAGKGVFVCESLEQAHAAIDETMVSRAFGDAGNRVVIEEFLGGEEASILALIDGEHVLMLASSQDHKRALENDEGPNTGGMGAYSPAPVVTDDLWPIIREQVFERLLTELRKRGIVYRGVLYAGLMIEEGQPKVLEYNCRFGDPEAQAVFPRIDGDLLPALNACVDGNLDASMLNWSDSPCVCVVMASGGYPGSYEKGKAIEGLDRAGAVDDVVVFHAGTDGDDGNTVTSGGRVLAVSACGPELESALERAYSAVSEIHFDGAQFRRDIAHRALDRVQSSIDT
jgi:phosphoribosylamine--glycine ligase